MPRLNESAILREKAEKDFRAGAQGGYRKDCVCAYCTRYEQLLAGESGHVCPTCNGTGWVK